MLRQGSPPPSCNVFLSVIVTPSLLVSVPLFHLSFFSAPPPASQYPSQAPLQSLFPRCLSTISPLLHFSLTPTPSTSFLFLQCSPSFLPRLLQQKSQHRENQHVCVCTSVCVCDTTVNPRASLTRSPAMKVKLRKSPRVRVERSDQNIDCWRVTSQPCKQTPFKSLE